MPVPAGQLAEVVESSGPWPITGEGAKHLARAWFGARLLRALSRPFVEHGLVGASYLYGDGHLEVYTGKASLCSSYPASSRGSLAAVLLAGGERWELFSFAHQRGPQLGVPGRGEGIRLSARQCRLAAAAEAGFHGAEGSGAGDA